MQLSNVSLHYPNKQRTTTLLWWFFSFMNTKIADVSPAIHKRASKQPAGEAFARAGGRGSTALKTSRQGVEGTPVIRRIKR